MALISKLPRKEKALAKKRRREFVQNQGMEEPEHTEAMQVDNLDHAFTWDETKEGFIYWNELYIKHKES